MQYVSVFISDSINLLHSVYNMIIGTSQQLLPFPDTNKFGFGQCKNFQIGLIWSLRLDWAGPVC